MDEIPPQVPGYRLTRVLGTGSTSTVWRARRVEDDALVAIKLVPGEADEEALREYSLLQHAAAEHVVTLHETLAVDTEEGPATALVLEHLAGGSLGRAVAERGHLSPGETVTVLAPIAEAVTGLHDLGIVHGDLSPGNVLLDSTGRPVLADLGYARLTGETPGDVFGTEGHIAPEVLDGTDPTRESDVHGLGALAWLCLVGTPPGHVAERAELTDHVPDAPELAAVVEACLSTDPALRPEAHEVARQVFDAVPAQPLRMTATGDVASSLTRRIREAAHEGVSVPQWQRELAEARPEEPVRRWWSRRRTPDTEAKVVPRPRRRAGRHAAPRHRDEPIDLTRDVGDEALGPEVVSEPRAIARSALARVPRGAPGVGRPGGRGVTSVVAVVVGLLLAVLVPWHQLASAGGDPGERPSSSAQTGETTSPEAGAVLRERSAPRTSPSRLVRELTSLRERVVADLDLAVLEQLDDPGSPAATRDRELVEELRGSGQRYRGFTMTVRSASLQSTHGARAVVRTVIDESAYEVVDVGGAATSRPARRGQQVDLVLAWQDGAWRVHDVRAS